MSENGIEMKTRCAVECKKRESSDERPVSLSQYPLPVLAVLYLPVPLASLTCTEFRVPFAY